MIESITVSSSEQSEGVQQVNKALEYIDTITQSNTAGAEKSAVTSEELSTQAEHLMQLLSRFRLSVDIAGTSNTDLVATHDDQKHTAVAQISTGNQMYKVKPLASNDDEFSQF